METVELCKIGNMHIMETEDWWVRQQVVNTVAVTGANGTVQPGTNFTVMQKYQGLTILSEPCPCCGSRILISQVPYEYLAFTAGYPKG